jgi:hypothetical protein
MRSGLLLAPLLLAACSQEAAPPPEPADAQEVRPDPAAAPAAVPAKVDSKSERRCGWLSNPTPGNWWLTDKDGQWVLGTQGADETPGMDGLPDMTTAGWVETNGRYGYGCACITIAHDPATRRVTRMSDARAKLLRQCRADRSLPKPE